ncbi:MAG: hypothetical protein Q7K40_05175 [bacterium]|nr:hypothetical protein [bacterium]
MLIKLFSFSKKYFFSILTLSIIFVGTSQIWAGEMVYKDEDLRDVRSGLPLGYHSIDFVGVNASPVGLYLLPQKMSSFSYPGQGYHTTILPIFFLDIVITQIVLTGILFVVYTRRVNKEIFSLLSVKYIFLTILLLLLVAFTILFVPMGNGQPHYQGVGIPPLMSPSILPTDSTYETFGEVLEKEPRKEIFATATFTHGMSLEEVKKMTRDVAFAVKGFRHNTGESNGGCGVGVGETVAQALDNCVRDHSLFLNQRIEIEKKMLPTITDTGLRNAFIAHIEEAQKEQKFLITALDLYGRAEDLQRFKERNSFVEMVELMNQDRELPLMIPPSMSSVVPPSSSFGVPLPSPVGPVK